MTICIASVCEHNGREVFVIATDHMIDAGIGQFEHDIKKHKKIGKGKTIAMLAGKALLFNELIGGVKDNMPFSKVRETIFDNFVKIKKNAIHRELLSKFGIEEGEVKELFKGQIQNNFVGKLLEQIAKFELGTNILLVGFENGKAQIAEIEENGIGDFGDIHFHAIGSGQIQAINTLLFQRQSKCNPLQTTIYNVYKAKKNAEVSSGVGVNTDMLVLTEDGCNELTKEDITKLAQIYEEELNLGKNSEGLKSLKIFNGTKIKLKRDLKACHSLSQ